MTVAEAKAILGDFASGMEDKDIAEWLDWMHRLANIECDRMMKSNKTKIKKKEEVL